MIRDPSTSPQQLPHGERARTPLYLFQGDNKPGDTNGQGSAAFGAPRYALSSSGNGVTTSSGSTSGTSGY